MKINHLMFTQTKQTRRGAVALLFGLAMMIGVLLLGLQAAKPAHAAGTTFTVNSTGDENDLDFFPVGLFDGSSDGKCDVDSNTTGDQCTLRAAIQQANVTSAADTINFLIPSNDPNCDASQVCTISPMIFLPMITRPVTIDGYTQPDARPNFLTQPDKTDAVLKIELAGPNAELSFSAGASKSVVRGLAIGGCIGDPCHGGIFTLGGKGYRFEGNFIGTDADGTSSSAASRAGVVLQSSNNVKTSGSTIGGTTPDTRNLISGNTKEGVSVPGGSGNTVEGNLIGTDKDGNPFLSNGGSGVAIASGTGNRILSNSISYNQKLGIDLIGGTEDANGVTTNDPKDPDTGANRLQNYPDITSAQVFHDNITHSYTTLINGTLNSTPSTRKKKRTFIIQFFSSPLPDPSGHGEGKTFLGQIEKKTNSQGDTGPFTFPVNGDLSNPQQYITATATNKATGDTSEFSNAKPVTPPLS